VKFSVNPADEVQHQSRLLFFFYFSPARNLFRTQDCKHRRPETLHGTTLIGTDSDGCCRKSSTTGWKMNDDVSRPASQTHTAPWWLCVLAKFVLSSAPCKQHKEKINKSAQRRRKHCALPVVRRSQKFSPRRRAQTPSRGRGTAKI